MDALTIGSFVFFTSLVGLATYLLTRGDDHESPVGYFLAGRRLTGGLIAGSLLLTNLSTEQLVGINGQAFSDGLSPMAWEVIAAIALVAMGLFFLPRYLKSGVATLPQFLEERFDTGTRTIATLIFIVAYATILLPIILYTGATGLSGILNLQELTGISSESGVLWPTVWMIGILGSVYAIFGGLRTVAVSDTINGFGLLVGGILIAYFGLRTVAGEGGTFVDGWNTLREAMPEKFNSIGKSDQHVPFSTLFTGVFLLHVFYWCTNQQIIQRTLGASSLREGQKGVMIAASMKIIAPIIIIIPGMIAAYLYADSVKADNAYGTLVRDVLPPSLVGFFAAVIVGAVLSTYNSVLNSTATLFSLGVYQKHINPAASQQQIIRAGKWCGVVVAIYAMSTAPQLLGREEGIFGYMAKMNGLYSIPILAVVLVGILSKYVPALAAKAALLVGVAAIAVRYFVLEEETMKLHEFHFLGVVFAVLVALMIVIGKVCPRSEAYEQQYSGDVDMTPWPWAKLAGAGIVLVVLGIYAYFADLSVLGQ